MADINPQYEPEIFLANPADNIDKIFVRVRGDSKRAARERRSRKFRVLCARYLGGPGAANKIVDWGYRALFFACFWLIVAGGLVAVGQL